jgi:hypothetical protein
VVVSQPVQASMTGFVGMGSERLRVVAGLLKKTVKVEGYTRLATVFSEDGEKRRNKERATRACQNNLDTKAVLEKERGGDGRR